MNILIFLNSYLSKKKENFIIYYFPTFKALYIPNFLNIYKVNFVILYILYFLNI